MPQGHARTFGFQKIAAAEIEMPIRSDYWESPDGMVYAFPRNSTPYIRMNGSTVVGGVPVRRRIDIVSIPAVAGIIWNWQFGAKA